MGKQQSWNKDKWPKQGGNYSPSWSMWRGAKQSRSNWDDRQPSASRNPFPSYDSVRVDQDDKKITVLKETRTGTPSAGSQGMSLVQSVQYAVNAARKSSNRVAKLKRDIELKDAQWQQYTRDLKASFAQEKERHAAAVQSLEQELLAAQEAAQVDQHAIQKAADNCFLTGGGAGEGDNAAWNALMAEDVNMDGPPTVPREIWEYMAHAAMQLRGQSQQQAGVTQRAAAPAPPGLAAPGPPVPPPPAPMVPNVQSKVEMAFSAPPGQGVQSEPKAPEGSAYSALSPSGVNARVSPYPTSSPLPQSLIPERSQGVPGPVVAPHIPGHPAMADGGHMHLKEGAGAREGVHTHPERLGAEGPSLGHKLDAKRAREPFQATENTGPAMRPFRQTAAPPATGKPPEPPGGLTTHSGQAANTGPTGPGPEIHSMQDDDNTLDVETSPGFANLE